MSDVLLNLANEALVASSNRTSSNATSDASGIDWSMVIKGLLPMFTIAIGFVGKYFLDHFFFIMTTLAEAETPMPGGLDSDDIGSEKHGLLDTDSFKYDKKQAATTVKPHYVTSSFRATIKHLNAEAGDLSMFRGIGAKAFIYMLMMPVTLAIDFTVSFLPLVQRYRLTGNITDIVASLVSCQVWAALIHIVISKPRNKFWFRRLPLSWISVLRHTALAIVVNCITDDILNWTFNYISPPSPPKVLETANDADPDSHKHFQLHEGPVIKISVAILLWAFLKTMLRSQIKPLIKIAVTKPVQAIEGRVFTSMLRDDEDPVIPFDRSFQGRPQSGGILQQQSQPLTFQQAARTIDKPTYLRLLKLELKIHLVKQILEWVFWTLIFAEVIYFIGPGTVWIVLKLILGTPVVRQDLDRVQGQATRQFFEKVMAGPANYTSSSLNVTFPAIDM